MTNWCFNCSYPGTCTGCHLDITNLSAIDKFAEFYSYEEEKIPIRKQKGRMSRMEKRSMYGGHGFGLEKF